MLKIINGLQLRRGLEVTASSLRSTIGGEVLAQEATRAATSWFVPNQATTAFYRCILSIPVVVWLGCAEINKISELIMLRFPKPETTCERPGRPSRIFVCAFGHV